MTVSNVTEQHLAKEALGKSLDEIKKSEDRLRRVIDTIPTLIWRAGPDGVPDFLSQPALDYTGLSLDQIWPRAFYRDDKDMLAKWSAIRQSGMRGSLEARLRRFDGEYRWFLFEAVPLRDESGNIVKWYGSSTDIEDRKLARTHFATASSAFATVRNPPTPLNFALESKWPATSIPVRSAQSWNQKFNLIVLEDCEPTSTSRASARNTLIACRRSLGIKTLSILGVALCIGLSSTATFARSAAWDRTCP